MRIWDIEPARLCNAHLLGEHRELHAIWSIITNNKKGYSRHPETLRWKGKLKALYTRHGKLVREMKGRGFRHKSRLDLDQAVGRSRQDRLVDPVEKQIELLRNKGCLCKV